MSSSSNFQFSSAAAVSYENNNYNNKYTSDDASATGATHTSTTYTSQSGTVSTSSLSYTHQSESSENYQSTVETSTANPLFGNGDSSVYSTVTNIKVLHGTPQATPVGWGQSYGSSLSDSAHSVGSFVPCQSEYKMIAHETDRQAKNMDKRKEWPQAQMFKAKEVSTRNSFPMEHPLLLRINPIQSSRKVKLDGIRTSVVMGVLKMSASPRQIGLIQLVPSIEAPVNTTSTLPSKVKARAELQFIYQTPTQQVVALVLPTVQPIKKGCIPRDTSKVKLLMAPEGPLHAEVLEPSWQTLVHTIAFGKHMAVHFSIPTVPTRKARYYKKKLCVAEKMNASSLYRKAPREVVEYLKAAPVNNLVLSTVEKCDPLLVHIVRLEQNPLIRQLDACDTSRVTRVEHCRSEQVVVQQSTDKRTKKIHNAQLVAKWQQPYCAKNNL